MLPSLAETRPANRRRSRSHKRKNKPLSPTPQRVDSLRFHSRKPKSGQKVSERVPAAKLAQTLQLQEQQRELIYSVIALFMKIGLLLIGTTSLVKVGMASHQRLGSYTELASVLDVESVKLSSLQERFDRFFTIGGDRRLMNENDQWIAPNRIRVIWR